MKRNLKALGLSMVGAFALSVVATSGAQATNHHLTVPAAPAIITGNDEGAFLVAFVTEGGEIRCNDVRYEGTLGSTTSTEVTVTTTYLGCTNESTGQPATMTMNHCAYKLTGETDANGDAKTHIECAGGSEVVIHTKVFFSECTMKISAQTPTGGAHYTQTTRASTGKTDVTVELAAFEIEYVIEGPAICNQLGSGNDGALTGAFTTEAYTEKAGCSALSGTDKTTPANHYIECESAVQDLELTTT